MTSRQSQSIKTKTKIVRVALRLIREKGYHNMSIRQLCQEADISIGAFYHHFKSKETLINKGFALYDEFLEELLKSYENINPIDDIRFIILNQTEFVMTESANLTKELYIAELAADETYAISTDRNYYKTILEYVTKAKKEHFFQSEMSAEEITAFILRTTRGVILDWCFHDYGYDLLEKTKADLEFVLEGLMRKE